MSLLSDKCWRVSAWGDDDFGLEKDFAPMPGICREDEAKELYNKIVDYTTQYQMKSWGMYHA